METIGQVDRMIAEIDYFHKIKQSVEGEYPYRFNPLDAVYIDENAQSRILAELLKYKCRDNSDHLFARKLIENLRESEEFNFSGNIEDIEVTVGKYRIDILIRQKKDFAIIIENKVYNAVDQPNQIDRYINFCRNYLNFKDDSIYVIYLTPRKSSIPLSSFCEENRSKFKGRYTNISVEDDLLEVLHEFKKSIPEKEILLFSGVDQYIDYLKYFMDSEKYNSEMSGKIKQELVNHLDLGHLNLVEKLEKIGSYNEGIESFMSYMKNMYNDFRKDLISHWYQQLSENEKEFIEKYNLELNKNLDETKGFKYVELIPKSHPDNISFRIEHNEDSLYLGIFILDGNKKQSIQYKYEKDGFITNDPKWYTWKWINNEYSEGISILIDHVMECLPKTDDD